MGTDDCAALTALDRLRDAGATTVSWIVSGSELLKDGRTPDGAALGAIYAERIHGPNSRPCGSPIDSAESGGLQPVGPDQRPDQTRRPKPQRRVRGRSQPGGHR